MAYRQPTVPYPDITYTPVAALSVVTAMLDNMDTNTGTTAPYATRTDFDDAVNQAAEAAKAYYDTEAVVMVDADYDNLVDRIAATTEAHPDWDDHGIATQVAAGQSSGGDVIHLTPMLSLSKTKTLSDIADIVRRINGPVAVEVKIDGLAIRAEYVNGKLVLAATRGDGMTGENVTAQVLRGTGINGLPATLATEWTGEVRGEIFMTDTDFEAACNLRVERGGKPFANPRNATAGSLRKTGDENFMPMSFAAYDITGEDVDNHDSYLGRMAEARHLGFQTATHIGPDSTRWSTPETVTDAINRIETLRDTLGFPIDGAVIKADLDADRTRLGSASRTPRWATSFKYSPRESVSVLRSVEVAIGRTGRMSLIAHIDPVLVDGSVVSKASGHNAPLFMSWGLGVGHRVMVVKRGDIIPYISLLDGDQPADVTPWVAPETCPQCGEEWDKSSILWRCQSSSCGVSNALAYFAARDCMDVDSLGQSVCDALVEANLANNIADLYDLSVEDFAGLRMGTTSTGAPRLLGTTVATKIVNGLEASKSQPFNRIVTSLSIRKTGRSVGRWLASAYPTMDALRAATVADIAAIDRLGDIKATYIVEGLAEMSDIIDRLSAHGVNMGAAPDPASTGDLTLAGQTYVVSGSVPGYTRTTVAEAIERLGGKASSSVSKTTTALVTSETGTSKAKKAESLGIPVIDPDEFVKMLEG